MNATAFIYNLKRRKGKSKTYLIRRIFGYKDVSNHGKYAYKREGKLTPYIYEKWGRSVILIKEIDAATVSRILMKNKIPHTTRKIKLLD